MLWIDGSHDYPDVVNDIDDFVPHVIPGGWVVFDDAGKFDDVVRAIDDRMPRYRDFDRIGRAKEFAVYRRGGAASES